MQNKDQSNRKKFFPAFLHQVNLNFIRSFLSFIGLLLLGYFSTQLNIDRVPYFPFGNYTLIDTKGKHNQIFMSETIYF